VLGLALCEVHPGATHLEISQMLPSRATCWGCEHEQSAYDKYESAFKITFEFSYLKSGFVIHSDYPFVGAAPDG